MNVLVTGGSGFIGSNLCDFLVKKSHKVTVVDNLSTGKISNLVGIINQIDFFEAGIEDFNFNKCKALDAVIHLAAQPSVPLSLSSFKDSSISNLLGTIQVVNYCKQKKIPLVYASSSAIYGNLDKGDDASTKVDLLSPYAADKYAMEVYASVANKAYGLSSIGLRFFNVYGPRSRTSGTYGAVFGVFLAQKLAKKPYTVVGDGTQTRDFTFVKDVVDAIIAAAESDVSGEAINIGSDNTYSVNQLVELLGGDVVHIPKRPGEPDCTWADISKAKKLLNWRPKVSLEEGVGILMDNIDYWRQAPVWDEQSIAKATEKWFEYLS